MTNPSEQKPEPRMENGVGWCISDCPYSRGDNENDGDRDCYCWFDKDKRRVTSNYYIEYNSLCLPFQRQQAKEIKRLREFAQACADGEGNIIRNLEDHARLVLGPTETEGEQ